VNVFRSCTSHYNIDTYFNYLTAVEYIPYSRID